MPGALQIKISVVYKYMAFPFDAAIFNPLSLALFKRKAYAFLLEIATCKGLTGQSFSPPRGSVLGGHEVWGLPGV